MVQMPEFPCFCENLNYFTLNTERMCIKQHNRLHAGEYTSKYTTNAFS